jgi:glycosyltransferase involved in cell wall biosynthesis
MEQIDDNSIAVVVDVIIPVHNAASTIRSSVQSAMHQVIPSHLESFFFCDKKNYRWDIAVCCFDDGSTDDSWHILSELEREFQQEKCGRDEAAFCNENTKIRRIPCGFHFLIARGSTGSRGAGFARNQAATLRSKLLPGSSTSSRDLNHSFLCLLDSDDIMHSTRIAEQAHYMLTLPKGRELTLLGCTFDRDPADSTWHYAKWANGLPDERLYLERFREVTIIQPTWMMCRSRWEYLGGYLEAPDEQQTIDDHITLKTLSTSPKSSAEVAKALQHQNKRFCLVHPTLETPCTLRLAEDLRFFHAHVHDHGLLKLLRTEIPLVTYRHRAGMSQSCNTPRRLLLYLRVLAFESCVLRLDPRWSGSFVVWGKWQVHQIKNLTCCYLSLLLCHLIEWYF